MGSRLISFGAAGGDVFFEERQNKTSILVDEVDSLFLF